MTIRVNEVPANLRTPGTYLAPAAGRQNPNIYPSASLIVGRTTSGASAVDNTLTLIASVADANARFGIGSPLAAMAAAYLQNDPTGELWALPQNHAAGVGYAAAKWTYEPDVQTAGAKTTITIDDKTLEYVAPATALTAALTVTALTALINADKDLPVTAADGLDTITITHKSLGASETKIAITSDVAPSAGLAAVAGTGAITPDSAVLGDRSYEQIIVEDGGNNYRTFYQAVLNPRWMAISGQFGHAFAAVVNASSTTIVDALANYNYDHETIIGVNSPSSPGVIAAAVAGAAARLLRGNPARPLQNTRVLGIATPTAGAEFSRAERNVLLHNKASTLKTDHAGEVLIERLITTYSEDSNGAATEQWLDLTTLASTSRLLRMMSAAVTAEFTNSILVDTIPAGNANPDLATTGEIHAVLVGVYRQAHNEGLVENPDQFDRDLVVQRDPNDRSRVNAIIPANLANGFRVFAGRLEITI